MPAGDGAGLLAGNLLAGPSVGWWADKHNRQHADPNRELIECEQAVGAKPTVVKVKLLLNKYSSRDASRRYGALGGRRELPAPPQHGQPVWLDVRSRLQRLDEGGYPASVDAIRARWRPSPVSGDQVAVEAAGSSPRKVGTP